MQKKKNQNNNLQVMQSVLGSLAQHEFCVIIMKNYNITCLCICLLIAFLSFCLRFLMHATSVSLFSFFLLSIFLHTLFVFTQSVCLLICLSLCLCLCLSICLSLSVSFFLSLYLTASFCFPCFAT